MKINKYKFLKVFAKHLSKKLSVDSPDESQLNVLAASLNPAFSHYFALMKAKGIIGEDERIDVDLLNQEVGKFFKVVPILNFPIVQQTITINRKDADAFIKDLFKSADVDEIIYLPCQN